MVVNFASRAILFIYNNVNYLLVVVHFGEKKTPNREIKMV